MSVKILIADDEYQAREGLAAMLARNPQEWTVAGEAKNGHEVVEKAILHRPDILITDIRMPGLSGIEVLQKLKEADLGLAVILLTGFSEFEYARLAVKYGAFDYLLKPCTHQEIASVIRRAVRTADSSSRESLPLEDSAGYRSVVQFLLRQIQENYSKEILLKDLADRIGMNPDYLSMVFRSEVGDSFSEYIVKHRIEKAKQLLQYSDLKVYEISEKVGYKDYKYFSKLFKQLAKMTPKEYKRIYG